MAERIGEIDCRRRLLPTVMQSTQQPLWNSTHVSGVSNFIVFIDYIVEVRTATRCGVVKLGWVPIFNSIWEHWRSQLWGTGACAPRRPAIYFFQFPLQVVWQRLFIFVFCFSSCCTSVAATLTLFIVSFRVIVCEQNNLVLCSPHTTDWRLHCLGVSKTPQELPIVL